METDKVSKKDTLANWRKAHWYKIMEKTRKEMEKIIDDPEASNREKIDAAKTLARMVSGLQPEKIVHTQKTGKKTPLETGVLPEKDIKEIEELAKGDW